MMAGQNIAELTAQTTAMEKVMNYEEISTLLNQKYDIRPREYSRLYDFVNEVHVMRQKMGIDIDDNQVDSLIRKNGYRPESYDAAKKKRIRWGMECGWDISAYSHPRVRYEEQDVLLILMMRGEWDEVRAAMDAYKKERPYKRALESKKYLVSVKKDERDNYRSYNAKDEYAIFEASTKYDLYRQAKERFGRSVEDYREAIDIQDLEFIELINIQDFSGECYKEYDEYLHLKNKFENNNWDFDI